MKFNSERKLLYDHIFKNWPFKDSVDKKNTIKDITNVQCNVKSLIKINFNDIIAYHSLHPNDLLLLKKKERLNSLEFFEISQPHNEFYYELKKQLLYDKFQNGYSIAINWIDNRFECINELCSYLESRFSIFCQASLICIPKNGIINLSCKETDYSILCLKGSFILNSEVRINENTLSNFQSNDSELTGGSKPCLILLVEHREPNVNEIFNQYLANRKLTTFEKMDNDEISQLPFFMSETTFDKTRLIEASKAVLLDFFLNEDQHINKKIGSNRKSNSVFKLSSDASFRRDNGDLKVKINDSTNFKILEKQKDYFIVETGLIRTQIILPIDLYEMVQYILKNKAPKISSIKSEFSLTSFEDIGRFLIKTGLIKVY